MPASPVKRHHPDRIGSSIEGQHRGRLDLDRPVGILVRRIRVRHRGGVVEEPRASISHHVGGRRRRVQRDRLELLDPALREAGRRDVVERAARRVDQRQPRTLRAERGGALDDRDPRHVVRRRRHREPLHRPMKGLRPVGGVRGQRAGLVGGASQRRHRRARGERQRAPQRDDGNAVQGGLARLGVGDQRHEQHPTDATDDRTGGRTAHDRDPDRDGDREHAMHADQLRRPQLARDQHDHGLQPEADGDQHVQPASAKVIGQQAFEHPAILRGRMFRRGGAGLVVARTVQPRARLWPPGTAASAVWRGGVVLPPHQLSSLLTAGSSSGSAS